MTSRAQIFFSIFLTVFLQITQLILMPEAPQANIRGTSP